MSNPSRTSSRSWEQFCERLFAQNQFAIKLGLDSMRQALEQLSDVTLEQPVVLIAGTNGKGSTASALSALLTRAGLRVGLYTSPHLVSLTERFRVQGQALEQDVVQRVGEDTLDRFGRPDSTPCLTFFELTTVMAARLFADEQVDVAIYEVGLGGRLDATNALEPSLSIITQVGLDHQAYLGDDVLEIAFEKAGIMRPDKPVILGPQEYEGVVSSLLNHAHTHQAHVLGVYGREFDHLDVPLTAQSCAASSYMLRHWSTAQFAAQFLLSTTEHSRPSLSPHQVSDALSHVQWHGRLERRAIELGSYEHDVILDAAHNLDGVGGLLQVLDERGWVPDVVWFGAMADKDIERMLQPVCQRGWVVQPILIQNARAADLNRFDLAFESLEASGALNSSTLEPQSLREVLAQQPTRARRVLVFGSLYLEGEFYEALEIDVSSVHST